jgi:ATP-dependent DNA helicase DinG
MAHDVTTTLAEVAASLPGGGEAREGQGRMAESVGRSMAEHRHLVVQAGTGTGKSLAYLVPAALSGQRVVVATATKALQDQLAHNDLPQVAATIDREFTFAVLKGRSNYLCRQRVAEIGGRGEQMALPSDPAAPPDADDPLTSDPSGPTATDQPVGRGGASDPEAVGRLGEQVTRLVRWADTTTTGDRAELEFEPHFRAWAAVSTSARECPGAFRCPSGRNCFAEDARSRAAEADVVVVNTHLYGAHLASGGAVLPPHQVVVFDEAHEVEEVMTDSLGVEIGPGRFRALAASVRPQVDLGSAGATADIDGVAELSELLQRVLRPLAGQRVPGHTLVPGDGAPGRDGPVGPPDSLELGLDMAAAPAAAAPTAASPGAGSSTASAKPNGRRGTMSPTPRGHGGTAPCWPPATWPRTWPDSPPSPTTRWRGWTVVTALPLSGYRPSTWARCCRNDCGGR